MAFPAIFPAGVSIIVSHEKRKKGRSEVDGTMRGRIAAGLDAEGATLGAIALAAFAWVVWRWLPGGVPWLVIAGATVLWAVVAVALWSAYRLLWLKLLRRWRRTRSVQGLAGEASSGSSGGGASPK